MPFTTQAGGVFDMSGVIFGMTAGSIAGGGSYFLGSNALIVGGNNLSTEVSGTIADGGSSGGTGGSLVKVGTGVLTLSGTNTYTGPTVVNAGVLIVNGSIAPSSLTTVNSGAVLLGSGTVGSTVVNAGGFLVPGNSPGTMTVAGDLTIQRNAFYVVQVNPLTASRTNVSGTASLDGTVAAVFFPGLYLARSYTILTADNRRTGRFEDLETFGLPRNFRARLDYFNNTVELNLRAQLIGDNVFAAQPIVLPPIPGAAVYTGGSVRPATAAIHRHPAQRRPCDRQLFQQRRGAAASIRVALWVVRQQSHRCPGPAFRRGRDRRAEGWLPDGEPVPQPHARSLRRWPQRHRRRRSPRARLCARARSHAAGHRARLCRSTEGAPGARASL